MAATENYLNTCKPFLVSYCFEILLSGYWSLNDDILKTEVAALFNSFDYFESLGRSVYLPCLRQVERRVLWYQRS
jgi:hypothetical protein